MINIVNEYNYKFDEEKLLKYIDVINKEMNNTNSFSLVFLKGDEIKALNNEFRGIDKVTDVLSFEDDSEGYMGDILVCIEKIEEQANDYNHSIERELFFLITHGYLHLLGYDHQSEEEEKVMFDLQKKLLNDFGIGR